MPYISESANGTEHALDLSGVILFGLPNKLRTEPPHLGGWNTIYDKSPIPLPDAAFLKGNIGRMILTIFEYS